MITFVNTILIVLLLMFTSCTTTVADSGSQYNTVAGELTDEKGTECKGKIFNDSEFFVYLMFTPLDKKGEPLEYARYFIYIDMGDTVDVSIIKDDYIVTSQPEDPNTETMGDVAEYDLLLRGLDDCTFDVKIMIRDNRNKEDYKKGGNRLCVKILKTGS